MAKVYARWQARNIEKALKTRRVLSLAGPRQCGKTTLANNMRQLAANDPHGFVKHTKKLLIIDEVQRIPALLSAIKLMVDEDTRTIFIDRFCEYFITI